MAVQEGGHMDGRGDIKHDHQARPAQGGRAARQCDGLAGQTVVSARQASEVLGVAEKTLANWRAAALGPPFLKYGNRNGPVRYVLGELIAWRDAHRGGKV